MTANTGDRIGDYEVVGVLGAGGMGRVYKVRNVISDRVEALKILLPDLANVPELADRFVREIKALAALQHPNIAALRTAQRIDNQLVMVMELVEGVPLEAQLSKGPIPVAEALGYASQALSALSYAHARGVIHRDIKPAKIMVAPDGQIKFMDFGMAKTFGDRKQTMTGTAIGYMSPEQIRGAEVDSRSDLYSFGVSLYEMVTGTRPFRGESDSMEAQPVPPIEVIPTLPPALNEIILTSIAKDPSKRFQSADAFRGALGSVKAATVESGSTTPELASPHPSGRRGLYMALGAIVAVVVLVLGAMQIPTWRKTRADGVQSPTRQAAEPPPRELQPLSITAQEPASDAKSAVVSPPPKQARPQRKEPVPVRVLAEVPPPQPAAVSQPVAADLARGAALKEIQKSWAFLASRAGAVSSSLQNLQQQQQRQGFGLRGDISASWKRMEYYVDQVDAAIKAKDLDTAKENLDSADREVAALERFLGR